MAADAMISNGQREKENGLTMQKAGNNPEMADKMIKQGEQDLAKGQAMKDDASMMK